MAERGGMALQPCPCRARLRPFYHVGHSLTPRMQATVGDHPQLMRGFGRQHRRSGTFSHVEGQARPQSGWGWGGSGSSGARVPWGEALSLPAPPLPLPARS